MSMNENVPSVRVQSLMVNYEFLKKDQQSETSDYSNKDIQIPELFVTPTRYFLEFEDMDEQ